MIDGNKTLKFSLPIKYNAVYKDNSKENTVVARKVEEMNVDIYVQLNYMLLTKHYLQTKAVYPSVMVTEDDLIIHILISKRFLGHLRKLNLSPNPIFSPNFPQMQLLKIW